MPYVPVPRDLTKVKTKVALGMTKRQLFCFSVAAIIGVPTFFLTRGVIGNSPAVLLMMAVMLPAFFLAMYERDGQPAEKILRNIIRSRLIYPVKRAYKTENLYHKLAKEAKIEQTKYRGGVNPPDKKSEVKPKIRVEPKTH